MPQNVDEERNNNDIDDGGTFSSDDKGVSKSFRRMGKLRIFGWMTLLFVIVIGIIVGVLLGLGADRRSSSNDGMMLSRKQSEESSGSKR